MDTTNKIGSEQPSTATHAVPDVSGLTDERIAELNRQAQDQAITGLEPSIYLARAIEHEVLATYDMCAEHGVVKLQICPLCPSGHDVKVDLLATKASADLSGLTRYGVKREYEGMGNVRCDSIVVRDNGEYVRLDDVQALLATHKGASAEPEQDQAHVLPPFAAPAGQQDANERAFDKLHADIMNLPCKMGRAIEMNGASKQVYKEAHRDARHAAAELVLELASRCRVQGGNTSVAHPAEAAKPEPQLCDYGNKDDFDEAHDEWERAKRYAEVGAMEYNGNTVSYMYSKAKNYGNVLLDCCNLLGGEGHVTDRIMALIAERDALRNAAHPAEAAPVAPEQAVPEGWRDTLYQAAIDCAHMIDEDRIILYRNPSNDGNALLQLADRLAAVVPPVPAPAEQGDDESLFWPPKALLKREDWDSLARKPKAPAEPSTSVPRVASIDTPEFGKLLMDVMDTRGLYKMYPDTRKKMRDALIAHIDAHVARKAQAAPVAWREMLAEMVKAMRAYEMDVDGSATQKHRDMMQRAKSLLAAPTLGNAPPDPAFMKNLERSRAKYPNNHRMLDGLCGELHELKRAYQGDGDVRAEAFDVAVCAYRLAVEGDAGGNQKLGLIPDTLAWGAPQTERAALPGEAQELAAQLRHQHATDNWNWDSLLIAADMIEKLAPVAQEGEQMGSAQAAPDEVRALQSEVARLTALLNTPETLDFIKGLQLETAHQRERWATSHDAGKTPADWFWLIGYLAQKAMMSQVDGDIDKALHHAITTAAALSNWHAAILGKNDMRPCIEPPADALRTTSTPADDSQPAVGAGGQNG